MVKENCIMRQVIFMKENGKMTKLMGEEPIIKKMVENMKETGIKINNMEEE